MYTWQFVVRWQQWWHHQSSLLCHSMPPLSTMWQVKSILKPPRLCPWLPSLITTECGLSHWNGKGMYRLQECSELLDPKWLRLGISLVNNRSWICILHIRNCDLPSDSWLSLWSRICSNCLGTKHDVFTNHWINATSKVKEPIWYSWRPLIHGNGKCAGSSHTLEFCHS